MPISADPASSRPVIGITLGDEAGIGPEIIEAALQSGKLDARFQYRVIGQRSGGRPGEPTPETARAARTALEEAAVLAGNREIDAVVTGPIHKARMQAIGFEFPGQTEFFAARTKTENFAMCLTGGALSVALVTAHLPLREVPGALCEAEIIRVGKLFAEFLFHRRSWEPFGEETDSDQKGGAPVIDEVPAELLLHEPEFAEWLSLRHFVPPRIAVAGLNPHAGESGALGREEIDIIGPAIAALQGLRPSGAAFTGPFSPDTVFNRAVAGEFDGVLCMYHDQGLIPLKLHAFDQGVNVTLGLPYPRTSPDHGTAFEIAGKNLARPESMIAAINLAADLARRAF